MALNQGETVLHAPKPLAPASDTMQVFIDLGAMSGTVKEQFYSGKLVLSGIGIGSVSVCDAAGACQVLEGGGAYVTGERYGLLFASSDQRLKGKQFATLKIYTSQAIPRVGVRWQNYSK